MRATTPVLVKETLRGKIEALEWLVFFFILPVNAGFMSALDLINERL